MGIDVKSAARTARAALATVRNPPYVAPGHFYSPTTTPEDAERANGWRGREVVGVDMRFTAQLALAHALELSEPDGPRWRANGMFGPVDASFLQGMIRHHGIGRVVEVGSGWSTAATLDAAPDVTVTCVEPYPDRLLEAVPGGGRMTLIRERVQDVDPGLFKDLGNGDVLFIDSTHVVKAGSDVAWLVLHVLPTIAPGVLVHVHDIHWPFEYPARWLAQRRDWTEAYLLRAFLAHNADWQVEVMTSWVAAHHPEVLPEALRGVPTGSLWMRRI